MKIVLIALQTQVVVGVIQQELVRRVKIEKYLNMKK